MNKYAAEFLFKDIEVMLLSDSIRDVYNIIRSPILCRNVKSLIYYCQRLDPEFSDCETWNAAALPLPNPNDEVSIGGNHVCWQLFCALVAEQRELLKKKADYNLFLEALKKLPNLEVVELVDLYWAVENRGGGLYSHWANLVRLPPWKAFLNACDTPFNRGTSPDVALLEALNRHNSNRIQRISLYDVPWVTWDDLNSFSFYKCIQITARNSFACLRSLRLELWVHVNGMGTIEYRGSKISMLCNLLRFAPLLEELSLVAHQTKVHKHTNGHISEESVQVKVTDVFWLIRWRKLRCLELLNCDINSQVFVDFFIRHASTLKDVVLYNLKLSDCSHDELNPPITKRESITEIPSAWEWAILQLRRVMNLRHCILQRFTDDRLAERIKRGDCPNGISVEWLVRSWRMELALYFNSWNNLAPDEPYWPRYGRPLVVADEDPHGDYIAHEDDD
jgi:hypothetical protein